MDLSAPHTLERYPFISGLIREKHAVLDGAVAYAGGWKDRVVVLDMQDQGLSGFRKLKCLVPVWRQCLVNDLRGKKYWFKPGCLATSSKRLTLSLQPRM